MIKRIIKKICINKAKRQILKRCVAEDDNIRINRFAQINLYHGSKREDISIGHNVMLYGNITSEYGGKVKLGRFAQLGTNSSIRAVDSVIVGDFSAIANNVIICDNNTHSVNPHDRIIIRQTPHGSCERSWKFSEHAPIIIGRNCWIGENSRICKGVIIGDGSIVAANAVVTKSVQSNSIVAGNPAKIVKTDIDIMTDRFLRDDDYLGLERY